VTPETSFEQSVSPSPKDAPCQKSMHSGLWFMRRRFLKVFAISTYIKLCPHRAWPFVTPGTSFEQT